MVLFFAMLASSALVDAPRPIGANGAASTSAQSSTSVLPQATVPPEAQGTQNPANPTGPNMKLEIDYLANVTTLTAEIVNKTSIASGQDISGNSQLVDPLKDNTTQPGTLVTNQTKNATTSTGGQQPLNNNSAAGIKPQPSPTVPINPILPNNQSTTPTNNPTNIQPSGAVTTNSSINPSNNSGQLPSNNVTVPSIWEQ